ncbi:MAG TPA: glycosyltransferase [Planctomycetota bacterium]|nr:glycosyltransferase [Planctomycetota bacterium]
MRIAIASHSFPPARLAGVEVYAEAYARALVRAGHEVSVFAGEKDVSRRDLGVRRERRDGYSVAWLVNNLYLDDFRETYDRPAADAAFAAFLAETRPEVLHAMHLSEIGAGILETARVAGVPAGFSLHDYWLTCPRFGQRWHPDGTICETIDLDRCASCLLSFPWRQPRGARAIGSVLEKVRGATGIDATRPARATLRALRARRGSAARSDAASAREIASMRAALDDRSRYVAERIVPNARVYFAPTRFLAEELWKRGVPRERTVVRIIGIDTAPLRGLRRTPSDRVRVAFHGSIQPSKAPHLLVEAWRRLPDDARARGRLVIRGAERDPAYARALARSARAVGASLEAEFTRDRLPAALAETDLLVVPSVWWENSPLTILEAQAARVPLLVSDLGGMAELVEPGAGGYRFRPGDVDDLSRQLAELLRAPRRLEECAARAPSVRSIDDDAAELPMLIARS